MKIHRWYLIGCLLPLFLMAETQVKGTVKNEKGEPLPGANVFLQKTLEGATTDIDGTFRFTTEREGIYTLLIRYMGYSEWLKVVELKGKTIDIKAILKESALKTEGVIITASSFTTGEEEGVTLTPLEVLMTPGAAADVCWAIKSYPGVQQTGDGAGLFVRGGEVTETKFILDGGVVQHPYRYESPTGGFFGTFSPFLLKGTYFSSGGFSVIYGNALSGVLAMESLDPPIKLAFNLGLGLASLSTMGAIPIKDEKIGINFSGNKSNTKTMFKFNGTEENFTEYPSSYDINLNLGYRYSKDGLAKLFLFKERDNVGVQLDDPNWEGLYCGDGENNLVNLQITHVVSENCLLNANASHTRFYGSSALTVNDTSILDINTTDKLNQARLLFELNGWWKLKGGGEFKEQKNRYKGIAPEEDSLDPSIPSQEFDTEYKSKVGSGFFEMTTLFPYNISLTSGVRVDYEFERGQYTHDERLSLSWQPLKNFTISGATGTFHQFSEAMNYDPIYGNPELNPMEARHYILSANYAKENDIIRLEAYYKDYTRLLLEDDSLNFTTKGHGYAKGIDFFIKKDIGRLESRLAYSYLIARRHWKDFSHLAPPEFDITHNLNAILNLSITNFLGVGTRLTYATGKPYTPIGESFHSERVPDYYKIDLNLSYLHSFYPGNFTVFYLAVNNITQRTNILDYHNGDVNEPVKSSYKRLYYFGVSFGI
ncbi:TonB-dependent receptor [candidate division WOR-3 bacterium]|nr:TonB-dependent receptor [candidate division WOR-3 bacterium]